MTLLELLKRYTVEIPLIQRDYAQGRADAQARLVRETLLRDMKRALCRDVPPLDLNFVYGGIVEGEEGETFIPIDGQQRLTTLFLLHLYAFRADESRTPLLRRFTYETRESARRFFQYITEHRAQIFAPSREYASPLERITDSEAFGFGWQCDPSVQSALVMLDAIAKDFADVRGLADRLLQSAPPLLSFHFLSIKNLGSGDSLYIKLNARGKPLTPFENFKAKLLGRLQTLPLPFSAGDFERRFDGVWTDFFWQREKSVRYEEKYYLFFKILLVNSGMIEESDENWVWALRYGEIPAEVYLAAYRLLDYLCESPSTPAGRVVWGALENPTASGYAALHAVAVFLREHPELAGTQAMYDWVRLFRNLIGNSVIDDYKASREAVREIDQFAQEEDHFTAPLTGIQHLSLRHVKTKGGRVLRKTSSIFDKGQLKEETVKAAIILAERGASDGAVSGGAFETEIARAEALPFFGGQIRAGLYYAKDENEAYGYDLPTFRARWAKLQLLFRDYDAASSHLHHGILLRRALLSIADYTLPVGGYQTFCSDHNDAGGSISLKAIFSQAEPVTQALLDELDGSKSAEKALKEVIGRHIGGIPQSDWRYTLIHYPGLFSYMNPRFSRMFPGTEYILLVKNLSANGYNMEVFTGALKYELERRFAGEHSREFFTGAQAYLNGALRDPETYEYVGRTLCGDYFLVIPGRGGEQYMVRYSMAEHAFVMERSGEVVFTSQTDTPITETADYICKNPMFSREYKKGKNIERN